MRATDAAPAPAPPTDCAAAAPLTAPNAGPALTLLPGAWFNNRERPPVCSAASAGAPPVLRRRAWAAAAAGAKCPAPPLETRTFKTVPVRRALLSLRLAAMPAPPGVTAARESDVRDLLSAGGGGAALRLLPDDVTGTAAATPAGDGLATSAAAVLVDTSGRLTAAGLSGPALEGRARIALAASNDLADSGAAIAAAAAAVSADATATPTFADAAARASASRTDTVRPPLSIDRVRASGSPLRRCTCACIAAANAESAACDAPPPSARISSKAVGDGGAAIDAPRSGEPRGDMEGSRAPTSCCCCCSATMLPSRDSSANARRAASAACLAAASTATRGTSGAGPASRTGASPPRLLPAPGAPLQPAAEAGGASASSSREGFPATPASARTVRMI